MDSRQKLKRFLATLAQGQGPELPAVAKLAVRGLLPRILADVDDADPDALDATMLEVARGALGIRSDDADPYELVEMIDDELVDDDLQDPDQERRSESDGEPRTDEPRHQGPGRFVIREEMLHPCATCGTRHRVDALYDHAPSINVQTDHT